MKNQSSRRARIAALVAAAGHFAACSASDTTATKPPGTRTTSAAGTTTGSGGSGGGSGATGGSGGATTGAGAGAGLGGGGGTAGTGGSGGTGTPPARDASSDITFDWPEGDASRRSCKPGVYQGNFSCTGSLGDSGIPAYQATGPISLKLVQSQQGEFLEVREGVLDGTANIFFVFRADISGKLDCKTLRFAGTLEKGTYSGFLVINGTFQGPLASDYDRNTSQFTNGVWNLTLDMGNGECNGTWSAAYTGPGD